ncbi:hypothetical protein [Aurantimonas coralicida]|mgnify:CR=1 FL=1|uniref:hypothetical protein n=1 Tax=Aurantimonas coralicida TaxID=182270 RepID=UPI00165E761D|nr:hypothetical protein [Aurantimonas coralicida]MCC4299062.1 hypothetical protein [Aurantimonas coralicida]
MFVLALKRAKMLLAILAVVGLTAHAGETKVHVAFGSLEASQSHAGVTNSAEHCADAEQKSEGTGHGEGKRRGSTTCCGTACSVALLAEPAPIHGRPSLSVARTTSVASLRNGTEPSGPKRPPRRI